MLWTSEDKIFCVTTYLEIKSFKTISKQMQPINMIMILYWDKKLKKKKKTACPGSWYNNNFFKKIDLMSLA